MEKMLQFNNEFTNKLYAPTEELYWEFYLTDFEKQIKVYMELREYGNARVCVKELEELYKLLQPKFANVSLAYWAVSTDLNDEIAKQENWYNKVADYIR